MQSWQQRYSHLQLTMLTMKLPAEVWHVSILPFLSWKEICRVDTAVMQREHREKLRDIYQYGVLNNSVRIIKQNSLDWIVSRHIKPSRVIIEEKVRKLNIAMLCGQASNLQSLTINTGAITDADITLLANCCTGLHELVLCNLRKLTNKTTDALARNCHLLRLLHVNVRHNNAAETLSLTSIAQNNPYLEDVQLAYVSINDQSIVALVQHCPHLTTISLDSCHNVTATGLTAIANHCPTLRTLSLSYLKGVRNEECILSILQNCTLIDSLALRTMQVSDSSAYQIPRHCARLTSLTVSCGYTSHAIEYMLSNLPLLRDVSISNGDVNSQILPTITNHCPNLESLKVLHTDNITHNADIIHVLRACKKLRELLLADYGEYVDASLQQAIDQAGVKLITW